MPSFKILLQHEKFMRYRAWRKYNLEHRGLVGFCKQCGRPVKNNYLLCRRIKCEFCRVESRRKFFDKVLE